MSVLGFIIMLIVIFGIFFWIRSKQKKRIQASGWTGNLVERTITSHTDSEGDTEESYFLEVKHTSGDDLGDTKKHQVTKKCYDLFKANDIVVKKAGVNGYFKG